MHTVHMIAKIIIRFETQLHCFSHCLTDVAVNFRLFTCTNRNRQMYQVKSQNHHVLSRPLRSLCIPLIEVRYVLVTSLELCCRCRLYSTLEKLKLTFSYGCYTMQYHILLTTHGQAGHQALFCRKKRPVHLCARLWMNRSNTVKDITYHGGENKPGRSGQDSLAKTTLIILINIPKVIKIVCEPST